MFKKQLPIIFIGLSVVIAMLVLGWVVFVKTEIPVQEPVADNGNGKIIDDVDNDVPDDTEDNNDSEIDISNWKTYRNEEYGFEVEYPEEWELIYLEDFYPGNIGVVLRSSNYEPIKDGNVMHRGEIYIRGMDNKNNLSIEKLFSTFSDTSVFWFDKFDYTEIVINGNNGVLFDYIMESSPSSMPQSNIKRIEACIQGDKKVINISHLFLDNPNREVFDEILYSFEFIEKDETNKNYKLDCTDKLDSLQSKYSWYNRFKEQIIEDWSLDVVCYNNELNKVIYLKSKIDWGNYVYDSDRTSYGFSQLGIYDIEKDEYDKASVKDLGFYEGCGIIKEWKKNNEIIYQCGAGDAGIGTTSVFSYNVISKETYLIEECNVQVGREPEEICVKK